MVCLPACKPISHTRARFEFMPFQSMKSLHIPFLPQLDAVTLCEAGPMMVAHAPIHRIDQVNWRGQFPYCPKTEFAIARSDNYIYVHFINEGEDLRAEHVANLSPVAQDSCVEFFLQPPTSDEYWNFEFNCIGAVNASHRVRRPDAVRLSDTQIASIKRYASCGTEPFEMKHGVHRWTLTIAIPFELIGIDKARLPNHIHGNFYKCAGKTPHPHYLSWSPIQTEKPDFHRPDYFGVLEF